MQRQSAGYLSHEQTAETETETETEVEAGGYSEVQEFTLCTSHNEKK